MRRFSGLVIASLGVLAAAYANCRPRRPAWVEEREVVTSLPQVEVVRTGHVDRVRLAAIDGGRLYATEDQFLYWGGLSAPALGNFGQFGNAGDWSAAARRAVGSSRLARLLRAYPGSDNVVILGTGTVVLFYADAAYRSTDGGSSFARVMHFGESIGPHAMGAAATPEGEVYFGDFVDADGQRDIRIWRASADATRWEVAYTYARGRIGHVHAIRYDPYRKRLWVCSGDGDAQSELSYSDDGFRTVRVLGRGSQDYRIVSLIPTEDAVYWGTHGSSVPSQIFRWDASSGEVRRIREVGNPIWYSTRLKDGTMVLGTSYEPECEYAKREHPPRELTLLGSRDGATWSPLGRFAYHRRSDIHLGSGVLTLVPGNRDVPELYVSPFGTEAEHFTLQRFEIHWRDSGVSSATSARVQR